MMYCYFLKQCFLLDSTPRLQHLSKTKSTLPPSGAVNKLCKLDIMVGSALCHNPKICLIFKSTKNKVNKEETFF